MKLNFLYLLEIKTANAFNTHLLVNAIPSEMYYLVINEAFGKKIMVE